MSSSVGWVEAEGTEGKAQETGIPGMVLKIMPGDRVAVVAMRSVKAEGAKGDREEERDGSASGNKTGGSARKGYTSRRSRGPAETLGMGGTERVDRPDAGGPGKRGQRKQMVQPD